ncbi:hypothetical protein AB0O91_15700 [Kitasatospora sp. NPDC089797]|uniref:hypothetical protein n=1 Tax=Kitasatospora sp. NPDC089797 TaxID=3155298 RepID=UPI00342D5352
MRETKYRAGARPGAALGLALLTLAALSGCGGAGGGDSQDGRRTAAAAPATATAAATGPDGVVAAEQPTLPPPSSVANDTEKRKQVTITGCEATKDGWRATGTARNPGTEEANYGIVVYFTSAGATVLATANTSVKVKPGQSGEWEARQAFHAPQGTLCVLRGVA